MAKIGHIWGTREELLHPRDSHGRFRSSWRMPDAVVEKISKFLESFDARSFLGDGQAGQYAFNLGQKNPARFAGGDDFHRLRLDYEHANAALRSGNIDDATKKFVRMMEQNKVTSPDDLVLRRTVGPDAFGLTPEQMANAEELTGKLIADRGYGAARVGSPLPSDGQPRILMAIATPKGTSIIVPGEGRDDRRIFLDKDQPLRVTRVKPDGQGGYFMLAVAEPKSAAALPEPLRGVEAPSFTPQEREARIAEARAGGQRRMGGISDEQRAAERAQSAEAERRQAALREQRRAEQARAVEPTTPAPPQPQPGRLPRQPGQAPPARTEQPVSEVIGQGTRPVPAPVAPAPVPASPLAGIAQIRDDINTDRIQGVIDDNEAIARLQSEIDKLPENQTEGRNLLQRQIDRIKASPRERTETKTGTVPEKATIKDLRQLAKDRGIKIPSNITKKDDIRAFLESGKTPAMSAPTPTAEGAIPEKITVAELRAIAKQRGVRIPSSITKKADIRDLLEGKTSIPEKATPKFSETGTIPQTATIADLRQIAKDNGVKIPSSITKKADIRAYIERFVKQREAT